MRLRFRLLLKSINTGQLTAFSIASLIGAVIVFLGIWSYREVSRATDTQSSIFKGQYLVITKPVSSVGTIASLLIKDANPSAFTDNEIRQMEQAAGVNDIAAFRSSDFDVHGFAEFGGIQLSTRMFLESVPDRFIDLPLQDWQASVTDHTVPVIVPRTYLDFYNYGFAASNEVPQLSEGLVSAVTLRIRLDGKGLSSVYSCRIAGFSDRINSILVPESFLEQASRMFGETEVQPVRLIVETASNGFTRVSDYITEKGYIIEGGGESARLATVLKRVLMAVIIVGAVFSILAFVLLLVTVTLMIERNRTKNAILSSLGYTRRAIAAPYQLLAIGMDLVTCALATLCALLIKPLIGGIIEQLSPQYHAGNGSTIILAAVLLLLLSSALHTLTIYRRSR